MTGPPSTAQAGLVDLATGERRIASLPAGSSASGAAGRNERASLRRNGL
jgi:hypothetical protein